MIFDPLLGEIEASQFSNRKVICFCVLALVTVADGFNSLGKLGRALPTSVS